MPSQVRDTQAAFSLVISPERHSSASGDESRGGPFGTTDSLPSTTAGPTSTSADVARSDHERADGVDADGAVSVCGGDATPRRFLHVIRVDGCHYNVMTIGGRALLTAQDVRSSEALRDFAII